MKKVGIVIYSYLVVGLLLQALWDYDILPPCLWRSMTGWLCPGCGMTTATICLMKANWSGAWEANGLVYVVIPMGLYYLYKQRTL